MIALHRLWLSAFATLACFSFVIMRIGYLQIYCHEALTARAERSFSRTHGIANEERGAIYDRYGNALAMSIGGGACFADPRLIINPTQTAEILAPILQMPAHTLRNKLVQKRKFVWIARRLDPDTSQKVQQLKLAGIRVVPELKRFYPEESLAASVLGVVSNNQKGLSGVELVVDEWLREGDPSMAVDWRLHDNSPELAVPGPKAAHSVVLTIDRTLQYIAEQQLAIQMKLSRAKQGIVIMQDPQTGDILAMASAPSFNPNLWGVGGMSADYGPDTLRNAAVEKVFEPGSTFKAFSATAAIEEKVVDPSESIYCENGLWEHGGRKIRDHEKEGSISFTEVMCRSSNIGVAKVSLRLGEERFYRYARAFGFGVPTSCGLPGDGSGILRNPRQWSASSLATIAFGQEVAVTPLQMVNAYSAIANGGKLLEPRLYRGLIDEKGRFKEREIPGSIRRVASEKTMATVRAILKQVVVEGTGKSAQVVGIVTAGKTGTAQKIDPRTKTYSANQFIASFCGFAPADHPKIVVGVFLDEPQTSQWGGQEAAPLFGRIIRDAAPYLHLQPAPIGPVATIRSVVRS